MSIWPHALLGLLLLPASIPLLADDVPQPWERRMQALLHPHKPEPPAALPPPLTAAAPAPSEPASTPSNTRYLGSLKQGSTLFVFIAQDDKVYALKQGDTLGQDLRLAHVSEREVSLVHTRTHEQRLLSLE